MNKFGFALLSSAALGMAVSSVNAVEVSDSIDAHLELVAPVKIEGVRDVTMGTFLVTNDKTVSRHDNSTDAESGYFRITADTDTVVQLHINAGDASKDNTIVMTHEDDPNQKIYVPYLVKITNNHPGDPTVTPVDEGFSGDVGFDISTDSPKDWFQLTATDDGRNIFIIPGGRTTELELPANGSFKPGSYKGTVVATVFYN